jgi:hypothetical protein
MTFDDLKINDDNLKISSSTGLDTVDEEIIRGEVKNGNSVELMAKEYSVSVDVIKLIVATPEMRKFEAETASTNETKDAFNDQNLEEICKIHPQNCAITIDFDQDKVVGKVISALIIKGKAVVEGVISADILKENGFVVPHGRITRDGDDNLKKFVLGGFGYVLDPTDKSLSPIEYID